MNDYNFTTTFVIDKPVDEIWFALLDISKWKSWWKVLSAVTTQGADLPEKINLDIGVAIYHVRFTLSIIEVKIGQLLKFDSKGDLEGTGELIFEPVTEGTKVIFHWHVHTTPNWMNVTAPILRSFFVFSHNMAMRSFAEGLAKKISGKVLNVSY